MVPAMGTILAHPTSLHRPPGRGIAKRVAVISGGDAHDHYAAPQSARSAAEALVALGYEPVIVSLGASTAADLLTTEAHVAVSAAIDGRVADGGVQELCGALGIACAGASAAAHRTTSDKAVCSALLARGGIAVPMQRVLSRASVYTVGIGAALPRIAAELGPHVFVKPQHGRAGQGVRSVRDFESLPQAVMSAFSYGESVVVEKAVAGTECTVLITGDEREPWAAGVAEVLYRDGEEPGRSAAWARLYVAAMPFGDAERHAVVDAARGAARVMGCAGLATVDLILDDAGVAWVLDIDCLVDWSPGARLGACLANNEVTRSQFMASLLTEAAARDRRAA
jgi:D-alanine-D-alanine ligase